MRFAILSCVVAAIVSVAGCAHYRSEMRAAERDQAEEAEKIKGQLDPAARERLEATLPRPRERVEVVPESTPTPTPTPNGLLDRRLDAAGEPPGR